MCFERALRMFATGMPLVLAACGRSAEQAHEQHEPDRVQAHAPESKTLSIPPLAGAPHWSYEGETGPESWGALSADWSPCGEGRSQSPIDIHETMKADLPAMSSNVEPVRLKINHDPHAVDAVNNGHTIQVNYTEGDMLEIGDEQFQLLQYHFHSPSEHTVGGQHHPMEMHLVHKSVEGKLAVIGVFIDEGGHNAAFDPIWSNLPRSKGVENHLENVTVEVNSLLPAVTTSYRYDGSLTTPPCSEGVQWIIMATPIQLSAQQIDAFRSIVRGNNRPVQPLNGRPVTTDLLAVGGTQ